MKPEKDQDRYHSGDAVNKRDEVGNTSELDSRVNTDFSRTVDADGSLTNDESADTDPNAVPDKPKFKSDESR